MKSPIRPLIAGVVLATSACLHAAPVLAPNGDFEISGGADWTEAGDPNTTFAYPTTGGNGGGYATMANNGTPFGVLVANAGVEMPLSSLGLSAGESYNFIQDMRLLSGSSIGGMKIEFYVGGSQTGNTGDVYLAQIGDGTTWETYNYPVTIPAGTEAVKIVPLWGPGSEVGYDNIGVDDTPVVVPPAPPIPNADFEIPNGSGWGFFENGGHSVSWPTTGGNPGGFAQIDASAGGGFAGIAANGNSPLQLSTLGLTAGETYTFTLDMKIISGPNIGKFKVEFVPTGTGDLSAPLIGDGSTWETYSFDITIPSVTTQIFIVPLWGADSVVGIDNVAIVRPFVEPFRADITTGTIVSWFPEGPPTDLFQPQRSLDGVEWEDVGPLLVGNAVTSVFDPDPAPFYRVIEQQEVTTEANPNGSFELEGFDVPPCADSWVCGSPTGQFPTRITTDARTGDACMRLAVVNDASAAANKSEILQDIFQVGGTITPGESYDFSFWAKQISSGVSYVQQYQMNWLADGGAILPGGVNFTNFSGGDGIWEKVSVPGLVAPAGATSALIQIFGATGAVAGPDANGEVLIDDVSLGGTSLVFYEDLEGFVSQGLGVSWPTEAGKTYQVKTSTDLRTFVDYGGPITGDGSIMSIGEAIDTRVKAYKVYEMP